MAAHPIMAFGLLGGDLAGEHPRSIGPMDGEFVGHTPLTEPCCRNPAVDLHGFDYAFSVFSGPLAELRGWSGTEVALGFTISAALSPIPMILGGKLVDLGHARSSMVAGGLMFGLAFVGSGLIPSLPGFYFAYGILGGLGAGFAYAGAIGNVIRYFPDRRGMATGLVTAGNGAAAVITAPVAGALI